MQGGAAARPFVTHINALDIDLYLRIAPELFLKRAWSAASRGSSRSTATSATRAIDSTHSPEFAMLEAYQAYGDYDSMAVLTRELVQEAAVALCGDTVVTHFDGTEFDLGGRMAAVRLYDAVSAAVRRDGHPGYAVGTAAREIAGAHDLAVESAVVRRASWSRSCSRRWCSTRWSRRPSSGTSRWRRPR